MTERPSLASIVLTLRPLPQADPTALLPPWWGRAAHALLLNLVSRVDPRLAETLHDESQPRPFTASTLMGRFPHGTLDTEQPYHLRLAALQPELAAILLDALQPGGALAPGAAIELDYHLFQVEGAYTREEEHPWAGCASYESLGASFLLAKDPPPRRLALQFTSPTTFKSGGKHQPLPLPDLVFGSLADRWNAFAPIRFPDEARRYAAECLVIGRYSLESRRVPAKGSGLRIGAVGQAVYTTLNYDRYWMSVMSVLAAFARFSSVGAGVAMGLGQCRWVPDESREGG